MVIVPIEVSIVAVYRLEGSMHIGGGWRNSRRTGLDPSSAGQGVAATVDSSCSSWQSRATLTAYRPRRAGPGIIHPRAVALYGGARA